MTCVFLMMECFYGCVGMDPGIPNEAIPHGFSLWHLFHVCRETATCFIVHEKYQSPLGNTLYYFTVFPLYCLHGLNSFICSFTVATDVLSPLSNSWQYHTHSHNLLRIQAKSFSAFGSWATTAWFFFLPTYTLSMPFLMSRNTSLVSTSSTNLSLMNLIRSLQIISDRVMCLGISVQAALF